MSVSYWILAVYSTQYVVYEYWVGRPKFNHVHSCAEASLYTMSAEIFCSNALCLETDIRILWTKLL